MNVKDDLRSGRCPLQVTSDPNPQLVDVCVFTIIRRDRQRVGDGQQLHESKEVRSSVLFSELQVVLFRRVLHTANRVFKF